MIVEFIILKVINNCITLINNFTNKMLITVSLAKA